jgi:hypothetical protein
MSPEQALLPSPPVADGGHVLGDSSARVKRDDRRLGVLLIAFLEGRLTGA